MKRKRIPKSRPIKREQAMALRVTFQFISSKKPRVRREDETVRSVTGKELRASRRRTCNRLYSFVNKEDHLDKWNGQTILCKMFRSRYTGPLTTATIKNSQSDSSGKN